MNVTTPQPKPVSAESAMPRLTELARFHTALDQIRALPLLV